MKPLTIVAALAALGAAGFAGYHLWWKNRTPTAAAPKDASAPGGGTAVDSKQASPIVVENTGALVDSGLSAGGSWTSGGTLATAPQKTALPSYLGTGGSYFV